MSYTFQDPKKITFPIRKNAAESAVLRKLRSYLDEAEPGLVRFLVNIWNSQGKAITYKELREAIMAGEISADYLDQWRQDYSKFVLMHMLPAWEDAMRSATEEMAAKYPEWYFNPSAVGVREWTQTRSAEFVVNVTQTQIEGLRAVVRKAAVMDHMTADQLARVIRPMVGLYKQQAIANLNYYNKLIEKGVNEKKALDLSIRYSARQNRYRAYNIARTELAYAYNKGAHEGVKQAQEKGYMRDVVKIWCTADDERVCPICGGLEGETIGMDEEFNYRTKLTVAGIRLTPPAHPGCRCTVLYEEVEQ